MVKAFFAAYTDNFAIIENTDKNHPFNYSCILYHCDGLVNSLKRMEMNCIEEACCYSGSFRVDVDT